MIGFFENTWFAWWALAVVIILRWFHLTRLTETSEMEIDQAENEKKTPVAA